MTRLSTVFGAALIALAAGASSASAQRVQAGTLTCDVSAGLGLIVASQRTVNCVFTPSLPGPIEYYNGAITKVGVDVGVTGPGQLVWAVYTETSRRAGALAGSYAGATAELSIIAGLGANVLVGGNNRSVALQPLSIQGQTGLNIAAGIGELALQFLR